ncbi:5132_t:CDS:2 [Ambispora gerdemannii]|uniref:5132_t:CDS:1 n=1 Tax=Ambispora gerdemannii TaxID=144530 RepID=A0A9N8WF43_9GLOM|nr:5132_t:CDS:2 [Ambispora gerdemannii]
MPIQEDGDLINILLERGVNKYDVELKDLKTKELRYRKTRHTTNTNPYCITLIDPISDVAHVEIQGQKSNSKSKQIIMFQPDDEFTFDNTGKITFEYKFRWENEEYYWQKRGNIFSKDLECKMVHDPDPSIGIALYQQKSNTLGVLTLMYWNMDRIPVNDKRGLEYVLCITMLAFLDEWDDKLLGKSVSLIKNQDNKVNLTTVDYQSTPPPPPPRPNSLHPNSSPQFHHQQQHPPSPSPSISSYSSTSNSSYILSPPNSSYSTVSTTYTQQPHQHPNPLPSMPMPIQTQQSPAMNIQQQYHPIYAHDSSIS